MLWTMEKPENSNDDEHIKIQTSSKRRKVIKKEKTLTKVFTTIVCVSGDYVK
jgi:hypothetical protein